MDPWFPGWSCVWRMSCVLLNNNTVWRRKTLFFWGVYFVLRCLLRIDLFWVVKIKTFIFDKILKRKVVFLSCIFVWGVLRRFSREMMKFIILLGLIQLVLACPNNCICEDTETVCTISDCEDQIPLDYTDFLIIEGQLCRTQRESLNSLTPNTIIILKSDTCANIRNCR